MASRDFYLYEAGEFGAACAAVCERFGFGRAVSPGEALFAIAPKLQVKLARAQWAAPELGTLIFHPSLLPYRRGPDAIRWAVKSGEKLAGISWFWCDAGLDTGPVCEQEALLLAPGESTGRAYHTRYIPAALRALERAAAGIRAGLPRRIPQDEAAATYESFFRTMDQPPNKRLNPELRPNTAPG
jgi:methionyl-tRNA formyltransferase